MTKRDYDILSAYAAQVRGRYPNAWVWLFGSRARGDARADSDYDMCVVLDRLDGECRRTISEINWEVGYEYDVFITSVVFERAEFEHGASSQSPLVLNIRREAVAA